VSVVRSHAPDLQSVLKPQGAPGVPSLQKSPLAFEMHAWLPVHVPLPHLTPPVPVDADVVPAAAVLPVTAVVEVTGPPPTGRTTPPPAPLDGDV